MPIAFRDLQIGETFEFSREGWKNDLIQGPWRKTSARKYDHMTDGDRKGYRIGTIKVAVVPEIGQPTGYASALFTCTQWHSDQPDGVNLLSLGSTRKIHSEDHRTGCLAEIERNLAYSRGSTHPEYKPEIPRLEYLRMVVQVSDVGREWLSDRENMRINDALYQLGALVD